MTVTLPAHGVVPFEADGATWRLCFSVNAMCRLEQLAQDWAEDVGEEIAKILDPKKRGPAMTLTYRAAFWAALQDHHPELTQDAAGRLMSHVGLERSGGLIGEAFIVAFPAARPPKAPRRKRKDPA